MICRYRKESGVILSNLRIAETTVRAITVTERGRARAKAKAKTKGRGGERVSSALESHGVASNVITVTETANHVCT